MFITSGMKSAVKKKTRKKFREPKQEREATDYQYHQMGFIDYV
jgi:hypothetical protein